MAAAGRSRARRRGPGSGRSVRRPLQSSTGRYLARRRAPGSGLAGAAGPGPQMAAGPKPQRRPARLFLWGQRCA